MEPLKGDGATANPECMQLVINPESMQPELKRDYGGSKRVLDLARAVSAVL